MEGRAPSRPIIIYGHHRAWPSILDYEYKNISYRDYTIKSGNDLGISGSSGQSSCD